MTDIVTAAVKGYVRNPAAQLFSGENQLGQTVHGAVQTAEVHGRWFEANYRGKVFAFLVTAVTVPAIASGLVSVFTLYNPPGSGVVAELIETSIGQVLATTVVDTFGWYSSSATLTAAGTFTTKGTARSGSVQSAVANAVLPSSAYTHSGTPLREDIIGSHGATTNANSSMIDKVYNGELILPPGIAMSVAASTAAGTASGLDVQAKWAEWPIQ
jgi:hypothetical protein